MKTRVCHLTSVHAYNDTRIFHKECISLVQAGYEVTLIAPVSVRFEEKGVTVIPAGVWKNRYSRIFVTVPRLLVKALQLRASVYHFHDPELLLIVPFLKLSGARVIYDIHEDYVTSVQQKSYIPAPFRKLIASAMSIVEKAASAMCFTVIAERYYKERFPGAVEILNYPIMPETDVDVVKESRPDQPEVFDTQYEWCLYTGNVTLDRGALLHLNLLKSNESTAIAYIGKCSKELYEEIFLATERENISRERVRIIGAGYHVAREVIDYYTSSNSWLAGVALFPDTPHYTKKELTKLFEYMAAGLPILSSNFPAWKNIVKKNSCGLCVNPAEIENVASAIDYLLSHPDKAAAMGENGRKAVCSRYNWNIEERKLLDLYSRVSDSTQKTVEI